MMRATTSIFLCAVLSVASSTKLYSDNLNGLEIKSNFLMEHIDVIKKIRNLQADDSYCESLFSTSETVTADDCICSDTSTTLEVECYNGHICIQHISGNKSKITGKMTNLMTVDFTTDQIDNTVCLEFDDNSGGSKGCIHGLFSSTDGLCELTFDDEKCNSCEFCSSDDQVSIDCTNLDGGMKANSCLGDTLEGTPIPFLSVDSIPCPKSDDGDPLVESSSRTNSVFDVFVGSAWIIIAASVILTI